MDDAYIFIIGFNKTATRSLHHLFSSHGYSAVHWDSGRLAVKLLENLISGKMIFAGYDEKFRVFSDLTYLNSRIDIQGNQFFRIMDRDYPESYFIYNYRDTEDWIKSRAAHGQSSGPNSFLSRSMRINNTSDPEIVFELWRKQKTEFEREVRSYFEGNPRFLDLQIDQPDICGKLGSFLGRKFDDAHWRHIGKTPG